MKQTRGAITMLVAQYKAILHNAFIKNFGTVILASTVGISTASAVEEQTSWNQAQEKWQTGLTDDTPLNIQSNDNNTGGLIVISSGTHNIANGITSPVTIQSTTENPDAITVNGGILNVGDPTVTSQLYLEKLKVNASGTVNFKATTKLVSNLIKLSGSAANITNYGTIVNDTYIDVGTGSTFTNAGTITNNSGIYFSQAGDPDNDPSGEINVSGTLVNTGTITNASSGMTVESTGKVTNSGTISLLAGNGILKNYGLFTTNTGSTLTADSFSVENGGKVQYNGGTINVTDTTLTVKNGGKLNLAATLNTSDTLKTIDMQNGSTLSSDTLGKLNLANADSTLKIYGSNLQNYTTNGGLLNLNGIVDLYDTNADLSTILGNQSNITVGTNGLIKVANTMTISDVLSLASGGSNLKLQATNLVLGNSSLDTSSYLGMGFGQANITKSLTTINSSGNFDLKNKVILNTGSATATGTIGGSSSINDYGGNLVIEQGSWTSNSSYFLKSGSNELGTASTTATLTFADGSIFQIDDGATYIVNDGSSLNLSNTSLGATGAQMGTINNKGTLTLTNDQFSTLGTNKYNLINNNVLSLLGSTNLILSPELLASFTNNGVLDASKVGVTLESNDSNAIFAQGSSGSIVAKTLSLINSNATPASFTLEGGKLTVVNGIDSNTPLNMTNGAHLILGTSASSGSHNINTTALNVTNGTLDIDKGTWSVGSGSGDLTVGASGVLNEKSGTGLKVNNLTTSGTTTLKGTTTVSNVMSVTGGNVEQDGNLTVGTLDAQSGNTVLNGKVTAEAITTNSSDAITVTGTVTTNKLSASHAANSVIIANGGTVKVLGDGNTGSQDVFNKVGGVANGISVDYLGTLDIGNVSDTNSITYDAGSKTFSAATESSTFQDEIVKGTVVVNVNDLTGKTSLTSSEIESLKKALFGGYNSSYATIKILGITNEIDPADQNADGSYNYSKLHFFSGVDSDTTNKLEIVADNDPTDIDPATGAPAKGVYGYWGSLVQDGSTPVEARAYKTLELNGSGASGTGVNEKLVASKSGDVYTAASLGLTASSTVNVNTSGIIGGVTADANGHGTLNLKGANTLSIANDDGSLTDIGTDTVSVGTVGTATGSTLRVKNIYAQNVENKGTIADAKSIKTNDLVNQGSITVTDDITTATLSNTGNISATNLTSTGKANITGGNVAITDTLKANSELNIKGASTNVTASKMITGGKTTVSDSATVTTTNWTSTGDINIESNAVVTAGTWSNTGLTNVKSGGDLFVNTWSSGDLNINSSFTNNTSVVAIENGGGFNINVGGNSAFAYGMNKAQTDSALSRYPLTATGTSSIAFINTPLTIQNGYHLNIDPSGSTTAPANSVTIKNGGALVVTGSAISTTQDAVKLSAADASSHVYFDNDAKVIYDGTVSIGQTYHVFGGNSADGYVVMHPTTAGDTLDIESKNGFLIGEISNTDGNGTTLSTGDVVFRLRSNGHIIMNGQSTPTYNLFVNVLTGDDYVTDRNAPGVQFFTTVASYSKDGSEVENVAKIGSFGNFYQPLIAVDGAASGAVGARLGIGQHGNDPVYVDHLLADALWIVPSYRYIDSSYGSKGYGSNMEMMGVTVGTDHFYDNGTRLGILFNLGFGFTSGTKKASGFDNDFTYYGLGVYTGYEDGNFDFEADLCYNWMNNDATYRTNLENYELLRADDADSGILSITAQAQYKYETQKVDMTPHLGARFFYTKVDDFDIKSGSLTIAKNSNSDAKVFSIPLGLTFYKMIENPNWVVTPSLDLQAKFNFGDTTTISKTRYTGISYDFNNKADVSDDVVYGITLGIRADKNKDLSFALDASYEVSDHTQTFGLTGLARYQF